MKAKTLHFNHFNLEYFYIKSTMLVYRGKMTRNVTETYGLNCRFEIKGQEAEL